MEQGGTLTAPQEKKGRLEFWGYRLTLHRRKLNGNENPCTQRSAEQGAGR